MDGIEQCFLKAFETKKKRGWDTLYIAVDLHDTIVKSSYQKNEPIREFYPDALETLRLLSARDAIVLILFTSSYGDYLEPYYSCFKKEGIKFSYLNENPECPSTNLGDFSKKFYYNILLDDKAGFDPETDWLKIQKIILALP